jgi:hypothetical protein
LSLGLTILPVSARASTQADVGEELPQWSVLLHAHGALAQGWETVADLQRAAAEHGISAVFLTEHLIAEWAWGPPLLRNLASFRRREMSMVRYGLERFFRDAREADRQVPGVKLIAGAEVAPFYYWTGSPLRRNLTMWDWQRNLLVLGLSSARDYAGLPVVGLRNSPVESWRDILWYLTLAAAMAGFLATINRLKYVRASFLLAIGLLLIGLGRPVPAPFSPYDSEAGALPYQTLIDAVNERGGLTLWSQIEAVDDRDTWWGGVHTDAHPDMLVRTRQYGGFGSIYPATTRAESAGQQWDRVLGEYVRGERETPAWGWGELVLHYPDQLTSKTVWEVQTVLLAAELSEDALLEALRSGRGYAVRSTHSDGRLRLDRFEAGSAGGRAGSGEWLRAPEPAWVRAECSFTGTEAPLVTMQLVRDGQVVVARQGTPPLSLDWEEPAGQSGADSFYRLEIRGRNQVLLSNPVFVRRTEDPAGGSHP